MKRIPLVIIAILFSIAVLMAIRNRPRHPKPEPVVDMDGLYEPLTWTSTDSTQKLTMQTLTVDTLNVTNIDLVEQALIEELGAEQGAAIYRRVTELARAHRETNRGVFPGATTNGVIVEFEEEP